MCPKCSSLEVTRQTTGENVCAKCGHVFDDIEFLCPSCLKPLSGPAELINTGLDCPECAYHFKPEPEGQAAVSAKAASLTKPSSDLGKRVADIRRKAKGLASLAGAMILIAIFKLLVDSSNASALVAGVFVILGVLFFIASQAMYLRANTEK